MQGFFRLFLVILVIFSQSNSYQFPCGYPVLHVGVSARETTRLAQTLLNFALNVSIKVDGVFGLETTVALKQFEKLYHLRVSGYLDNLVWPDLISSSKPPLISGTKGPLVFAVQRALNYYGFSCPQNGVFDSSTKSALCMNLRFVLFYFKIILFFYFIISYARKLIYKY